jgi:hypothetical protein
MSKYRQGLFVPTNPHKYLGDASNIVYRSSWEKVVFNQLDNNKYILGWASEPIGIPYMKPYILKGKLIEKRARYYPDLYVEFVDANGKEQRQMVEIKPLKQTKPSRAKKPLTKLMEDYNYSVNLAKWEAAHRWCNERGIEFVIATEKSIFK